MGMFDWLTCEYPLEVPGANSFRYQTKDLDCVLKEYKVTEDGTLLDYNGQVVEMEDGAEIDLISACIRSEGDDVELEYRLVFKNNKVSKALVIEYKYLGRDYTRGYDNIFDEDDEDSALAPTLSKQT